MRNWVIESWWRGLLALLLLCTLGLSGCASILERSYSAESPHSQFSDEEKSSNILRANGYQELVTALLFLLAQGQENAIIRLYDYTGEPESDLEKACLEVQTQDPLGAYAVDYMKYEMAKMDEYTEVDLRLFYRRSWQQISSVSSVTGSSAILGELRAALLDFQKEKVLKVSYFDPSITTETIISMLEEAYYDVPEAAFGLPEVTVRLYPETAFGQQRLVEILLDYPLPREQLRERQAELQARAKDLLAPLEGKSLPQLREALADSLTKEVQILPEGEDTAHAALIDGAASGQGLVLAAEFLLQKAGLQCRFVRGERNGSAHSWLLLQMDDGWQHWDPTVRQSSPAGDAAMQAQGYRWSGDLPQCRELALSPVA